MLALNGSRGNKGAAAPVSEHIHPQLRASPHTSWRCHGPAAPGEPCAGRAASAPINFSLRARRGYGGAAHQDSTAGRDGGEGLWDNHVYPSAPSGAFRGGDEVCICCQHGHGAGVTQHNGHPKTEAAKPGASSPPHFRGHPTQGGDEPTPVPLCPVPRDEEGQGCARGRPAVLAAGRGRLALGCCAGLPRGRHAAVPSHMASSCRLSLENTPPDNVSSAAAGPKM